MAGKGFGCGSSREHAVWALTAFRFSVVIASSFADIFANNSLKNGLLTVRHPDEQQVSEIMRRARQVEGYQLTVDLESIGVEGWTRFRRRDLQCEGNSPALCLLNGFDDISLTLQHESEISPAYEKNRPVRREMKELEAPNPA